MNIGRYEFFSKYFVQDLETEFGELNSSFVNVETEFGEVKSDIGNDTLNLEVNLQSQLVTYNL